MARISIDTIFFSDKRVARLCALTGEDRQKINGRLLDLWHFCYEKRRAELTSDEIDLEAEWDGVEFFGDLLVKVNLAEEVGSSYRIKGVCDRIEYLLRCAERGRKGGLQSAKARASKPQANASTVLDESKLPSSTLNPIPTPIPTPNPTPTPKKIESSRFSPNLDEILYFWNSRKIIVHGTENQVKLKKINAALKKRKDCSVSEIKQAIDNYARIFFDSSFLWSHKWSLDEFLSRTNADKFYPDEFDIDRFPSTKKTNLEKIKQTVAENPYREHGL